MQPNCLEPAPVTQTVIQGENKSLNVRLVNADDNDPYDLTLATEIIAVFPSTAAPLYVEKKLSLSQVVLTNAGAGKMMINLTPADTNLLPIGTAVSFEVRVTSGGSITSIQLLGVLNVVASLFPTAP